MGGVRVVLTTAKVILSVVAIGSVIAVATNRMLEADFHQVLVATSGGAPDRAHFWVNFGMVYYCFGVRYYEGTGSPRAGEEEYDCKTYSSWRDERGADKEFSENWTFGEIARESKKAVNAYSSACLFGLIGFVAAGTITEKVKSWAGSVAKIAIATVGILIYIAAAAAAVGEFRSGFLEPMERSLETSFGEEGAELGWSYDLAGSMIALAAIALVCLLVGWIAAVISGREEGLENDNADLESGSAQAITVNVNMDSVAPLGDPCK